MKYEKPFQRLAPGIVTEVRGHLARGLSHAEVVAAMDSRVSTATVSRIRNAPDEPEPIRREVRSTAADDQAIALYRLEVARRKENVQQSQAMQEAKQAMQDRLALDKLNQRGGRPKGEKRAPFVFVKPGKPQLMLRKSDPRDALLDAVEPWGGSR